MAFLKCKKLIFAFIVAVSILYSAGCSESKTTNNQPSEQANANANSITPSTSPIKDGQIVANPKEINMADAFDETCLLLYRRILDSGAYSEDSIAKDIKDADASITYEKIIKNPEPFYGKFVVFRGRIIHITEVQFKDGKASDVYISVDRYGQKIVRATYQVENPFVEGNNVVIVGYLADHLYSYKSVSQWDVTVPLMVARAVLKPTDFNRLKALTLKS
jgi:hypothetical protein